MTNCEMEIATPADVPAITAIARATFIHDVVSEARINEKLFGARPAGMTLWETHLAHHDDKMVGFMHVAARPVAKKAWLGIFAVAPDHKRRGIATALLKRVEQQIPPECETIEALAIPGNYFTPGIDPRYTAGWVWLERRGFARFNECTNLTAPLETAFDTAAAEEELRQQQIEIRRANDADAPLLDAFFTNDFGGDWRFEADLALQNDPPALHLALRENEIVGFAAHSGQNREVGFFGPMGTTPAARGTGVGRVLLWHCLNDLRAAGHKNAVIPWVGPIPFYYRWAGCTVDRVFWRCQRERR